MQDLGRLFLLAHRRSRDDKAAVRKAALQLLEGLMLLRGGLPEPLKGVPSPQDIITVEAATADSLVRRAHGVKRLGGIALPQSCCPRVPYG